MHVERHLSFSDRTERLAFADCAFFDRGHEVQTDDHVLGWGSNRTTIGWLEDVVRCEHQHAGLGLSLDRKRKVNGHLVTVEVSVERGTYERVKLDCLAFNKLWFEGLDAETVQGWCTV